MKLLINIIFCFLFLLASQISHSESDALELRSEMSIGEFKNMGLSKLSDSELVRLYQWRINTVAITVISTAVSALQIKLWWW